MTSNIRDELIHIIDLLGYDGENIVKYHFDDSVDWSKFDVYEGDFNKDYLMWLSDNFVVLSYKLLSTGCGIVNKIIPAMFGALNVMIDNAK